MLRACIGNIDRVPKKSRADRSFFAFFRIFSRLRCSVHLESSLAAYRGMGPLFLKKIVAQKAGLNIGCGRNFPSFQCPPFLFCVSTKRKGVLDPPSPRLRRTRKVWKKMRGVPPSPRLRRDKAEGKSIKASRPAEPGSRRDIPKRHVAAFPEKVFPSPFAVSRLTPLQTASRMRRFTTS